jgi:hypothetical protein
LLDHAKTLGLALDALLRPMRALAHRLAARLTDEAETLDTPTRQRIEAVTRGLKRRAEMELAGWRDMLAGLGRPTPPEFVDWFAIPRIDGRDIDIGFYRHWVDPTVPFISAVALPAHGMVVTSATLTDGRGEEASDWAGAETRTGARHLPASMRVRVARPSTIRSDAGLHRHRYRQARSRSGGAAYRALFLAARGGGLGIFTAIDRLRAVHRRIAPTWMPPASRCWPSMWTGFPPARWSNLSAPRRMPACSAPMRCAMASMCRAARCVSSSSTACPGRAPPFCTGLEKAPSAARITTTP